MPNPNFRRPLFATFLSVLACLLALCAPYAQAKHPLPAEKAFAMHAVAVAPDAVEILFEIAPNYYLYGERFAFETDSAGVALGDVDRPSGKRINDPIFGEVETYHGQLRMRLPVSAPPGIERFTLTVKSQGCWEGGVCYPPSAQRIDINLTALAESRDNGGSGAGGANRATATNSGDESGRLAGLLSSGSVPLALVSFFGLGLLLAFTPCVFPMIPILSSIIVGAGSSVSRPRALALSAAYVLGMAIVYALAGVAAGLTGSLLAAALQNSWVLLVFALLFVLLALSMFGLYELRLPAALQNRLTNAANHRGHLGGVVFMGAVSALIASPCVTAPLAGALLYIATTGDAVLGGLALFTLALGMGVPLIIVALTAHSVLPKSGPWMGRIQKVMGVMLLGVALWIASPILPELPAVFRTNNEAAALLHFEGIASEAELDARLQTADRPVLLEFYADWCVSCKEMKRDTYSDPTVSAQMTRLLLLRVDVTAYNDSHKALLGRFGLVGPPGIVFFGADGQLRDGLRVVGFMPASEFSALLDRAL
jgi:thiol:disulfide interchange protein DsbD